MKKTLFRCDDLALTIVDVKTVKGVFIATIVSGENNKKNGRPNFALFDHEAGQTKQLGSLPSWSMKSNLAGFYRTVIPDSGTVCLVDVVGHRRDCALPPPAPPKRGALGPRFRSLCDSSPLRLDYLGSSNLIVFHLSKRSKEGQPTSSFSIDINKQPVARIIQVNGHHPIYRGGNN